MLTNKVTDTAAAELKGWRDAIDSIRASLRKYPCMPGGDIVIMHEVDRLCKEAYNKGFKAAKLYDGRYYDHDRDDFGCIGDRSG